MSITETEMASAKRRAIPGSTAFVPSLVGLIIAGEIVNDLAQIKRTGLKTGRE